MIKEEEEINYIKESIETTKEAIYHAMRSAKTDQNEACC